MTQKKTTKKVVKHESVDGQEPVKKPETKQHSSNMEARIKELELKLHKSDVNNLTIKIHSKWSEFKKEDASIEFLNGVQHALDNFKGFKTHSVARVNPPDTINKGTRNKHNVVDEDANGISSEEVTV